MNLLLKRRIDWFLGTALAVLLVPIAMICGLVFRRPHSLKDLKSITFIKLLGGGNFAIGFPMYLGLRRAYPDVQLRLLTTKQLVVFAEALNVFDEIIVVDDSSLSSLLTTLLTSYCRLFTTECIVDMEVHSKLVTCFSLLTAARNRIGFYTEDFFLRRRLYTHVVFFNPQSNRGVMYNYISILLGAAPADWDVCYEHLRKHIGVGEQMQSRVAIGPGCSDLARERMLSASQWIVILDAFCKQNDVEAMSFLGSKHDESISDQIISGVVMRGNKDISFSNLCGTLPFLESLRRLAESQVYIGIDSALLHYARILRVRCISYWGPSNPELRLLPIPHLQETVHYKRLICSPCVHVAELAPCRGHALCMKQFTEAVSPEDSNILKNVTFTPDGARSPQAKEDRT